MVVYRSQAEVVLSLSHALQLAVSLLAQLSVALDAQLDSAAAVGQAALSDDQAELALAHAVLSEAHAESEGHAQAELSDAHAESVAAAAPVYPGQPGTSVLGGARPPPQSR